MITALPACPYLVVVPATAIVVALASTGLRLGATGIVGGALLGLVWSTVLGVGIERLLEREQWSRRMANGSVFLGIVASGVMLGGGLMYVLLMDAATAAPSAVLSAMMQPTIPFFIIVMSPSVMEAHRDELVSYDTAKATIRFRADSPLPAALVRKLVKARVAENEARGIGGHAPLD